MIDWIRGLLADLFVQQWLQTLGVAGAVALALHVLGALGGSATAKAGTAAAALALGFAGGVVTIQGVPSLPPAERWQWSAWIAVAALVLVLFEEAKGSGATLRFVAQLALIAAIAWWIVRPSTTARAWSDLTAQLAYVGGGLAVALWLLVAETRAPKDEAWRVLLAWFFAAAAAAAVIEHSSDKLARAAGSLAGALSSSLLLAIVQRGAPLGRTAIAAASLAFASLALHGWCAHMISGASALLLAAAWSSALVPLRAAAAWKRAALAIALPLALGAGAWFAGVE